MMFTTRPTVNFLRTFILLFSLLAIAQAHPHPSKTYTTTVTVTETETTTAVSTPTGSSGSGSGNQSGQCNTGPIQCCQIVEPASGGLANLLLGLLGIILGTWMWMLGLIVRRFLLLGLGVRIVMLRLCAVRTITSTDLSQLDVYPLSLSSKPHAYAKYTWTRLMTSFTNLNDSHGVSYLALIQG
ncbi:hydrophobin 2 [Pyrrhoderma noxium]|uniref:Hydrophobin 2 n=1 Tax=Pyrrhoderma noxium TaxID=2282107 RepID=A0A286U5E7_9AGAM|nr:hydrophobin 2 [Pyrrhoderma noxium]